MNNKVAPEGCCDFSQLYRAGQINGICGDFQIPAHVKQFNDVEAGVRKPPHPRLFEIRERWGTPHRLASVFLGSQRGVESRAGFQHGAGDIEQAVSD